MYQIYIIFGSNRKTRVFSGLYQDFFCHENTKAQNLPKKAGNTKGVAHF